MYDAGRSVGMEEGRAMYAEFLRDIDLFRMSMGRVVVEWPLSCSHFLTKASINRVAWMGQAAACIHLGISRKYRSGFMLLNSRERHLANLAAMNAIKSWEANEN